MEVTVDIDIDDLDTDEVLAHYNNDELIEALSTRTLTGPQEQELADAHSLFTDEEQDEYGDTRYAEGVRDGSREVQERLDQAELSLIHLREQVREYEESQSWF